MSHTLPFAVNRMSAPRLSLTEFFDLVGSLGVSAVELRNDLDGVEITDGTDPVVIRELAKSRGVRILSINALQRFNVWNEERAREAAELIAYARDCGAEALVLCPRNSRDDTRTPGQKLDNAITAMTALAPMLRAAGLIGLVEPLGFEECSLRRKSVAVEAIRATKGEDVFRLVHDTFHHHLAGEGLFFPELTGLVHISGVEDRAVTVADMRDAHRVLVGPNDRLGNAPQIRTLLDRGYQGHFSFEPFADSVHAATDPAAELRASMAYLDAAVMAVA